MHRGETQQLTYVTNMREFQWSGKAATTVNKHSQLTGLERSLGSRMGDTDTMLKAQDRCYYITMLKLSAQVLTQRLSVIGWSGMATL